KAMRAARNAACLSFGLKTSNFMWPPCARANVKPRRPFRGLSLCWTPRRACIGKDSIFFKIEERAGARGGSPAATVSANHRLVRVGGGVVRYELLLQVDFIKRSAARPFGP